MAPPSTLIRDQYPYDLPEPHEEDDLPQLSGAALDALKEFYIEQEKHEEEVAVIMAAAQKDEDFRREKVNMNLFQENWQLSQFWYNKKTSKMLADEALREAGSDGLIVCISSPTAFVELYTQNPPNPILLLEYDERFNLFGREFCRYDYNDPLGFDCAHQYKGKAAFVLCDPPFLEKQCLSHTIQTIQYLLAPKGKTLLVTGQVMKRSIRELLGARPTTFYPEHQNGLSNEFLSYTTYPSEKMPWADDEEEEEEEKEKPEAHRLG